MSVESWCWKLEPCSPPLGPDSPSEWSLQKYEFEADPSETSTATTSSSKADLAQKLLDDLEEYESIKEETFSDWFEDKVNLPIFDDLQQVLTSELVPNPSTVDLSQLSPAITTEEPFYLKSDADVSYALGHGHLTPPQSPPESVHEQSLQATILSYEPSYVTLEGGAIYQHGSYMLAPPSPVPDLAQEMAVVDEVVRGVAQQWEQLEYTDSSSSRSSVCTEDSDDPEWEPAEPINAKVNGRRGRQSRPYTITDRRIRKKEQNKTAATRYRQKKKQEASTIVDEVRGLEENNAELTTKAKQLTQEISYLKGLMREMFRVKGLIQ